MNLVSGLREAGVEAALAERLAEYGTLLLEANRRTNLTGAKTPEALLPHLLDSLSIAQFVREPHVDLGSGGGLPALPLAIAGGVSVTLIEATAKKTRFLEKMLRHFALRGEVLAARAEVAAHEGRYRERFASGTARAVASGTASAELLLPFIALGGSALLQRSKMTPGEREVLADAGLVLGGELEQVLAIGDDRCLAILRKNSPTAQRFPRRTGIPVKRPLCS